MNAKYLCGFAAMAALWLGGCGDDTGSGGAGGATTATTTSGPATTATSTTAVTTAASTSVASSSSTGMAVCPPDAMDPECTACAKTECCDQAAPCLEDAECSACMDCVAAAMDPTDCVFDGTCDLSDPETAATYDCTADSCANECYNGGFSCTADPMGDPCIECTKANCCMEAQECYGSAACAQCIQCAQTAGDPFDCVGSGDCDLGDPATAGILNCVQTDCDVCLGG
jgi:hypothetical protein